MLLLRTLPALSLSVRGVFTRHRLSPWRSVAVALSAGPADLAPAVHGFSSAKDTRGQAPARNTHARTLSVLVSMCLSVELQGPTPAWLVRLEGKEAAGVAPPVTVPVSTVFKCGVRCWCWCN